MTERPASVDPAQLAARVRARRRASGLSLRAASRELGMSATTLARVESGEHLPDRENLLRLARWAEVALPTQRVTSGNDIHGPDASTIEAIELHLRADKDLAQDDAEMLLEIVKAAYDRLAGKQR